MSKVIGLIFIAVLYTISASAQKKKLESLFSRFELVGGGSFSKNSGYLSDYGSVAGFSLGVGYYQKLSNSVSLNFRSLYETKGSTATYNYALSDGNEVNGLTDKYTDKFNYLSFYVLPTFDFGKNKNFHVSAGGYYSLLQNLSVNTYTTNQATGAFINEYTTNDIGYFSPKYDAGVSFQFGYSFNMNDRNQLMIQAFGNRGLVDLYNPQMGSQRNNTCGLTLSFRRR
jgi:hypothetical protein